MANYRKLSNAAKSFIDMEAKEANKRDWYEDDEDARKEFFEVRKYYQHNCLTIKCRVLETTRQPRRQRQRQGVKRDSRKNRSLKGRRKIRSFF